MLSLIQYLTVVVLCSIQLLYGLFVLPFHRDISHIASSAKYSGTGLGQPSQREMPGEPVPGALAHCWSIDGKVFCSRTRPCRVRRDDRGTKEQDLEYSERKAFHSGVIAGIL